MSGLVSGTSALEDEVILGVVDVVVFQEEMPFISLCLRGGASVFLGVVMSSVLRYGASPLASRLMSCKMELRSDSSCSLRLRLELTV